MARTFKNIRQEGKGAFVLFDTGSLRSYVREEFALEIRRKTIPFKVDIGGYSFNIDGRVENWRSTFRLPVANAIPFGDDASVRLALSLFPAPPHQTVRSVFPNTAFQSSSSRGFHSLSPWSCRGYLV